jgi:HPt (histidine-containing phosphotransfer) domain-containing protein
VSILLVEDKELNDARGPEEVKIRNLERDLPGFSIRAALHRVMGNIDLYHRLLQDFAEDRADAAETVMGLLGGDTNPLCQYAHGLKGDAGNLGIDAVHEAAAAVVTACRNGSRDRLPELSRTLGDSCRRAVTLLNKIRPVSAGEDGPPDDSGGRALAIEKALPLLKRLAPLLETNHFRACEVAGEASALFAGTGLDHEFHEIVLLAQNFRFRPALEKLRALMEKVTAA